jgi:hypothetical protein
MSLVHPNVQSYRNQDLVHCRRRRPVPLQCGAASAALAFKRQRCSGSAVRQRAASLRQGRYPTHAAAQSRLAAVSSMRCQSHVRHAVQAEAQTRAHPAVGLAACRGSRLLRSRKPACFNGGKTRTAATSPRISMGHHFPLAVIPTRQCSDCRWQQWLLLLLLHARYGLLLVLGVTTGRLGSGGSSAALPAASAREQLAAAADEAHGASRCWCCCFRGTLLLEAPRGMHLHPRHTQHS